MGRLSHELVVRGGRVVTPDGVREADIAVSGGRICDVLPSRSGVAAAADVDARGLFVLPGLIDSHVHFRTPGLTHKEDWAHASRGAVAGGVTTVLDMPNTDPPTFSPGAARDKDAEIRGTSLVDYRFHAGVDPADVDRVRAFAPFVATSAKAFLTGHHTAPHVLRELEGLDALFRAGAERGLQLVFHAEDDAVFSLLDRWLGEPSTHHDYERHRPRSGGIVAVARLIELCRRHGTPVHVLHVSGKEEADLLTAAGAAGLPVTWEVLGHHLSFTAADTQRSGSRIRLSPSIREDADRERLWEAVLRGDVTTVGSDHAPHPLEDKERAAPDAPPGLPGVQELFPALFTGLRRRRPDIDDGELLRIVARVLASEPARLFGLDHRKGAVIPGRDADLVLVDPSRHWSIGAGDVQARCGWSAYEGWQFTGRVERTFRRGATAFRRTAGGMEFGPPDGRWLDTAPSRTTEEVSR